MLNLKKLYENRYYMFTSILTRTILSWKNIAALIYP